MHLGRIDLREMKKRGDIEGLLSILDTGDTREIGEAVRILGELRSRKAIRQLIGLFEIDNIQIRANSAWALGEIGDVKAVLPLIGLLNDPSENVRVYAAWALGKIGDERAIAALNAALKNGSPELRKQAKEAIAKIESNKYDVQDRDEGDYGFAGDDPFSSELIDIPLLMLDVPTDLFECDYVSKVEGESKQGNTMRFSGDVIIEDAVNAKQENTRRIVMGLKNDFSGLVSIDILFKYIDSNGGGEKTSSVWLQMATVKNGAVPGQGKGWESGERIEEPIRRDFHQDSRKTRIKPPRKRQRREYDFPEYRVQEEPESEIEQHAFDEPIPEDYTEQKVVKKRDPSRRKRARVPVESEIPELREAEEPESEIEEPTFSEAIPEDYDEQEMDIESVPQPAPEAVVERPKAAAPPPQMEIKPEPIPQPAPEAAVERPKAAAPPPEIEVKPEPLAQPAPGTGAEKPPAAALQPEKTGASVDSAVRLLSDIGMTGMTEAASTVTQLGGQEAESFQSQLRTLPVEQIPDELVNLGENIASVEVKLHGKSEAGEMKGEMQMYFPKNVALDIANELLCNAPDAAVGEFTDDIISTLKETANIFGGQYVSAISEYIEIPIFLEAPGFKTGASAQIAESLMKDISGKVEFVLSTDLAFGKEKTGRLIMLLDPKSYDIIITKLF